MPRKRSIASVSLLVWVTASAACRVEQTPAEFIDHEDSIETERATATAEVRDRLLAFVGGMARGDAAEAVIALNPGARFRLVGPDGDVLAEGEPTTRSLIAGLAATPVSVRVREVDVRTSPNANVAWFILLLEAPGTTADEALYRATGLYIRDAGLWELEQAHLSGPLSPPESSSLSEPAADSAEAE